MTKTSPALARAMDAAFREEAPEEALNGGPAFETFDTDQGARFNGMGFTGMAQASNTPCSMDRRGRRLAEVFIERLWRSLKYGAVAFLSGEKGPAPGARFGPPGKRAAMLSRGAAGGRDGTRGEKARWTLG